MSALTSIARGSSQAPGPRTLDRLDVSDRGQGPVNAAAHPEKDVIQHSREPELAEEEGILSEARVVGAVEKFALLKEPELVQIFTNSADPR
jgi:hypothetical protein